MPLPEALYEGVLALTRPAIRFAGRFSPRLRQGVRGRAETLRRFRDWAAAERSPVAPLVWVHAPSVGEALMAQAIIRELRARRPDLQIAFTHFSTSAERMVADVGADVWGYVPWDTRGAVRDALAALRPAAVVFVRTEVWPVLAREASGAGARLLLVNAVLSEGSGRMTGPGRRFMEPVYRRLHRIGAVARAHADRYERLGVPAERIRVTGDARFDQVWARVTERGLVGLRGSQGARDTGHPGTRVPEDLKPIWRVLHDPAAFTVVAGSTWPADEKVLLPAVSALRRDRPLRLVIAPHEPTASHLEALERRLDRLALSHTRLGALLAAGGDEGEAAGEVAGEAAGAGAKAGETGAPVQDAGAGAGKVPEVVVVDRMGVLADLYGLADAAYVGGGFGRAGLHSVVEPAAIGVPVLFGPAHGNAREAGELASDGGGFVVASGSELEQRLRTLVDDPGQAVAAGDRAREYVRSGTGSAARNAELVLEAIGTGSAPAR